jgi:hypothetical protein
MINGFFGHMGIYGDPAMREEFKNTVKLQKKLKRR